MIRHRLHRNRPVRCAVRALRRVPVGDQAGVMDLESWPLSRIAWLSIVALVLVVGSFVYFANFSGAPPGSTYVPAHIENGKFVPGQAK